MGVVDDVAEVGVGQITLSALLTNGRRIECVGMVVCRIL